MGKGKKKSAGEDSIEKGNKFVWSNEDMKILLGILVEILKKNGHPTTFQWPVVVTRFHELSKSRVSAPTVKNKYNYMKVKWGPCNRLRYFVTGAGWDDDKHMVTVTEEWWERNKAEDFYTFKLKPIPKDVSNMMDELYMDTVATGKYSMAVSGDLSRETPSQTHNETQNETQNDVDESSGGNDSAMDADLAADSEEDADTENPIGDSPATDTQLKKTKAYTPGSASGSIKKMKMTLGNTLFVQSCDMISKASDCIISTLSSNDKGETGYSFVQAANMLSMMVEAGLVEYGKALWCYAMSELAKPRRRDIFDVIPDDAGRVSWLNHEYTLMLANLPK